MADQRRFKSPALEYAYDRYVGNDASKAAAFEEELANAEIASRIYKLRKKAGLSQRQLAARIGTTASVICRVENADYAGHSLPLLRRIGAALNMRVVVRFVPARRRTAV
ncbi:MAG: helix-turn-helix transcriptional regulator [Terriglobia bacterium]|jgi:ribosome-binding protein aMBF1 (putative translation factor)